MKRSDIKSIITLSNPNFYKKIIQKYQTGKRNTSRYPRMIFYKERGHIVPQKISVILKFRLHLDKQTILPSLILKKIPAVRGMLSRLNTEKNTLQSMTNPKNAHNINDITNIFLTPLEIPGMNQIKSGIFPAGHMSASRISVVPFLKSLIFRAESVTTDSNKTFRPSILSLNAPLYQQAADPIYPGRPPVSSQILNYENNIEILNSQIFKEKINYRSLNLARHSTFTNEKNILKNQSAFENKLPAILLKDNLLSNNANPVLNRDFFKGSNLATVNEPLMKNYHDNLGHGTSSPVQNIHAYKTDRERLLFHEQGRLEQEIEQIKKIMIETKESVLKKTAAAPGEADIKRHLDINRISDQVYQNIERTIRMERERRGF